MAFVHTRRLRAAMLATLAAGLVLGTTPVRMAAQTVPLAETRFDLTGNGVVSGADVVEALQSWTSAQEAGNCGLPTASGRDLTGNGCVDVADVQAVAANWGRTTTSDIRLPSPADVTATAAEQTFTVTSSGFAGDDNWGDGVCHTAEGTCTLKAAIDQASNRSGRERIVFNVRGADGSCPALVTITAPAGATAGLEIDDIYGDGMTIDGYTQCGAQPNTLAVGSNAVIKVELKGNLTQDVNGLELDSPNNVVRGLAIYNWDFQLRLDYAGASRNRIEGNFLGTNAANTFTLASGAITSFGEQHHEGLRIQGDTAKATLDGGAAYNIIGGLTPDTRNVIAGNRKDGLKIQGNANNNRIVGNIVGLKQDGKTRWANYTDGMDLEYGPKYNWVGGPEPGAGNVVSGNYSEGLEISHTPRTQFNSVVGNYFGLTADGRSTVRNDGSGLSFEDEVDSNYAYNNVIGGNKLTGVFFFILGSRNEVRDNRIGVGPRGEAMGNGVGTPNPSDPSDLVGYYGRNGVQLMGGAHHNRIANNIIANHPEDAVVLKNTSDQAHNHFGTTYFNTISRNSMYNNGAATSSGVDGIELKVNYEQGTTYPNQGLPEPTVTAATTAALVGRTTVRAGGPCAGCQVEVFVADPASVGSASGYAEGKIFVGAGQTAPDGSFAVSVCGARLTTGQALTATVTDPAGNTSQFSRTVRVAAATTQCTIRLVHLPLVSR